MRTYRPGTLDNRRTVVLRLPGIKGERKWVVLKGRGCVYNPVAGPFASQREAEEAVNQAG